MQPMGSEASHQRGPRGHVRVQTTGAGDEQHFNPGARKQAMCKGKGWGRDGLRDALADVKCLYRGWINIMVLLYTGDYSPYPVINIIEKNTRKNVYTCITESLCCTVETNTIL